MRFPPDFIDQIRQRFSPSEIIGRRIQIKRHGREFQAICPFHKEKTPSFTISDEKGFYHCFGCGAHGDVINFLKEFENLSYVEAVEKLAAEAGLPLPKMTREQQDRAREALNLQQVCEAACKWFEAQLSEPTGREARAYLSERGLEEGTLSQFRVGWAPDSRTALKDALMRQGIPEAKLIEAGLLIKVEDKPSYDRFRGRVMFPIRDRASKVVAFGGRLLHYTKESRAPKYMNSPEHALFHKGRMLFNFDLARRAAGEVGRFVVCEGYTDVIALYQAGIRHAVAPLGTAMTEDQLHLLWQGCDVPALCLDGDTAGERAMYRAAELALPLLKPGKSLDFIRLPQGEDPDSLVRQQGAARFNELAERALPLAEVLWQQVVGTGEARPEQRAGQEAQLMALCERMADITVRNHYRAFFRERLWPKGKAGGGGKKREAAPVKLQHNLPLPDDIRRHRTRDAAQLLRIGLLYPELLSEAEGEEVLATLELDDPRWEELRREMMSWIASGEPLNRAEAEARRGELPDTTQAMIRQMDGNIPAVLLKDSENQHLALARRVWAHLLRAYQLHGLRQEFRLAEQAMREELSEETLERHRLLKEQIDALEKAQLALAHEELAEMQ